MVAICWLIISSQCFSQSSFLQEFSGSQIENSIHLSFTISSGITCLGIDIERSVDSINFTRIGTIGGVCGSTSDDITYSFNDTSPLTNQVNYYRLLLGQVGYSTTIRVQYIDYNQGAVVLPNPLTDAANIYFPNVNNQTFHFKLFDSSGRVTLSLQTRDESILLKREKLGAGIYFFVLSGEGGQKYYGKVIIL